MTRKKTKLTVSLGTMHYVYNVHGISLLRLKGPFTGKVTKQWPEKVLTRPNTISIR